MLQDFLIQKIKESPMKTEPFSHIVIDDFLPKEYIDDFSNLPNYDELDNKVYFQDKKQSKKSVADNNPDKSNYNLLLKKSHLFKEFDDVFKKDNLLKNAIFDKFSEDLDSSLTEDYRSFETSTSLNYSVSIPGYSKEIHVDRREHLINILLYVSESSDSANLELWKEKSETDFCDVFPSSEDLVLSKRYSPKKNTAVIMINFPWAYHAVDEQKQDFLNRKYIYVVFDFEKTARDDEKHDSNDSLIWKKKVLVSNEERRQNFLYLKKN